MEICKNIIGDNESCIIIIGSNNTVNVTKDAATAEKSSMNVIDWKIRGIKSFSEIMPVNKTVFDPETRAKVLDDVMEKMLFYSKREGVTPTIRLYGYYTAFSSIRCRSETSDMAKLELGEKDQLVSWAKRGYQVKAIISLQPQLISGLAYTAEQYMERTRDLYRILNELKYYKNFQMVVDDLQSMESLYIFDTLFFCEATHWRIDKDLATYTMADFIQTPQIVENKIKVFDERFAHLEARNRIAQTALSCSETGDFIMNIAKSRGSKVYQVDW